MGVTRCAVLGKPIAHSLSPVLHRAAYDELGLDWSYTAVEVDQAGLAGFLDGLDASWRGLSLTMPLKRAVLPLLDEVSPVARAAGAANTVLREGGTLRGENTDVPGAVAAIRSRSEAAVERAVVVGGGATAASMMLVLAELGCREATLLVRDPGRAAEAAEVGARRGLAIKTAPLEAGPPGALDADLVVSTIPATAQSDRLLARLAAVPVVFEVVYDGWPTPLARSARDRVLVGGLDLLVHQAVLQLRLMTGIDAERAASLVPVLAEAGTRALAAR